jgi:hypothetical protein
VAIPEAQLETWSHQGAVAGSATTYNAIKAALEDKESPYAKKDFNVFLQGSYGNDTNIYAESDVDTVIQLNDVFEHDLSGLVQEDKDNFNRTMASASYTYRDFRRDVQELLKKKYGDDVKVGEKAINIAASGGRRKGDVIASILFRRYYKFKGFYEQQYDEGICFYTSSGERIANYPKQHSSNLTKKHQSTSCRLKPMIRILKNLRSRLVENKAIEGGTAPSYYLEGLLYNVPNENFTSSYEDSLAASINWLLKADRSEFVCANEQYYLLRENSPVTWRSAKCDAFLTAAVKLWNEW